MSDIRKDFPALNQKSDLVYFDNACTTLKPNSVILAQRNYEEQFPACAERSGHRWGERVSQLCLESRLRVAEFIRASRKEEIIFTKNATEGINLVAHSLGLEQGNIVLTSDKEHNSNLVPWIFQKKKKGIEHKIIPSQSDNTFDFENFKIVLSENKNIKLVSIVHTSNLDGHTFPVKEIIDLAHEAGALVLLDSTQAVSHRPVDVKDLDVDFLVFSGHKMLAPAGIGVLYGKLELLEKMEPFLLGGGTVDNSWGNDYQLLDSPQKFEAGIQNYSGILGLGAAIDYLKAIGFTKINEQERVLNSYISEEFKKRSAIEIIGPGSADERGAIVTFNIKNKDAHEVATLLGELDNIMVRAGQFCVHSWFNSHQVKSAVRASFCFYNTLEEAEVFIRTINKIIEL